MLKNNFFLIVWLYNFANWPLLSFIFKNLMILGIKNKITNPKELISRSLDIYKELSLTNLKNIKNVYLKEIKKYINE